MVKISSFSLLLLLAMIGSCSSPDPRGCALPLRDIAVATNSVLSPLLSASIRHSRNAALLEGARPIPDKIRSALEPFFETDNLDRVRWTVASNGMTLDTLIAAVGPRYRAMTFEDTIVFRNEVDADDVGLWTHEMLHVEQIRRAGGTSRFSRVYLASWAEIEAATVQQTNHMLTKMDAPVRQRAPSMTHGCRAPALNPS